MQTPSKFLVGWLMLGAVLLLLLYFLLPHLAPLFLGIALAYILLPITDTLAQWRIPRWLGAFMALSVGVSLIGCIVFLLANAIGNTVPLILLKLPQLLNDILQYIAPLLTTFGVEFEPHTQISWLQNILQENISRQDIQTVLHNIVRSIGSQGAFAISFATTIGIALVVVFFLLIEWHLFMQRALSLVPPRWQQSTKSFFADVHTSLSHYLHGQLAVMALLAVYYSVALMVAGVDLALSIGTLTGVLVFIPFVGYVVGLILALVATLLQFSEIYMVIVVLIIYGVGQIIEGFVLTPKLVGGKLGIHPLVVILLLFVFGHIAGFIGVLLALPMAAIGLVIQRKLLSWYRLSDLYRK